MQLHCDMPRGGGIALSEAETGIECGSCTKRLVVLTRSHTTCVAMEAYSSVSECRLHRRNGTYLGNACPH